MYTSVVKYAYQNNLRNVVSMKRQFPPRRQDLIYEKLASLEASFALKEVTIKKSYSKSNIESGNFPETILHLEYNLSRISFLPSFLSCKAVTVS